MRKSVLTLALSACLFLLIVGAKWAIFDRFGSPMPDWDQWDAEAVELFIPWFEHDHFLSHLFHPHNEHRIILTKLQNLGLLLLNGQWDSRLEAVTNAMLHAALAVALWLLGRRWLARRWHAALFILIAALFGLPVAWQNILGGFHSQQYWLLVLSFVAIVTLPYARAWSVSWWLGTLSAALVLGSMGSGLLAAAIVLLLVLWRILKDGVTMRSAWPTLVFSAAIVIVGLATRVEVPWHQEMKARTLHDFFFSTVHSLQWPLRDADWAAAVLWLPWLLVTWRVVTHPFSQIASAPNLAPSKADSLDRGGAGAAAFLVVRADQTIAALGAWVIVQVVATAYARGAGADYPASRYMDTLAFGAVVNAVALGWLLTLWTKSAAARVTGYLLGVGWLVTLGLGLRYVCEINFRYELPDAKKYYRKAEANMRRYLATNDPRQLAQPEIPFPSAEGLIERLANPNLRRLMPVPIRASLPITSDPTAAPSGFEENNAVHADWENPPRRGLPPQMAPLDDTPTWGSFGAETRGATKHVWRSAPLRSSLGGWLKFETAGDLPASSSGIRLELLDAANGSVLANIVPSRRPGETWRAAYVRAPRGAFVIQAMDNSPGEWLAFGPPVEMASLSYGAWQATRHGRLILIFAGGATLLVGLYALVAKGSENVVASATRPL